jgi:HPt (histidine-containing phosphotransfer) domain-containing protein
MSQPSGSNPQELETMLQALWKSNYSTLLERVKVLRDAQDKLAAGALDNQARKDAESAAHKLAGILGSFGLPQGSALASKIEAALAEEISLDAEHAPEMKSWLDELEAIIASRPGTSQS